MWKDWFDQIHTFKSFADAVSNVYFQKKIYKIKKITYYLIVIDGL